MTRTAAQNGRRSRTKGHAFERWVANAMRDAGLPAERNIAQTRSAAREGCDVEGSEWWIECKVGAAPDPRAAYAQALGDRGGDDDRPIVVVWKRDRCEPQATIGLYDAALSHRGLLRVGPLVTMRFVDWLEIAKGRAT